MFSFTISLLLHILLSLLQLRCLPGTQSTPLQMTSYWKCESGVTNFRLDYCYNSQALRPPVPLQNVSVIVPVDGGVMNMVAKPNAQW